MSTRKKSFVIYQASTRECLALQSQALINSESKNCPPAVSDEAG